MQQTTFFFSGISTIDSLIEERKITDFCELISYWECRKWPYEKIVALGKKRRTLMIDSGAYSAYTLGKTIDVHEFLAWHVEFIKQFPDFKPIRIGLDVLGDWKACKVNQQILDDSGINFIATYHRPDPPEFLEWLLNRTMPDNYMAIGGLVTDVMDTSKLWPFLDSCYKALCNPDGTPKVKTHLFGIGDGETVKRYPATSSDSTSILWPSIYGNIMLPQLSLLTGEPEWNKPLLKICISSENEKRRQAGQHFHTLKPALKDYVAAEIAKKGFTIEQLEGNGQQRTFFNFLQWLEVTNRWPEDVRFVPKTLAAESLFD